MRSLATAIRRLVGEHPNACPRLLLGKASPVPGLRLHESHLEALQAAGYDEPRAAEADLDEQFDVRALLAGFEREA